MTGEAQLAFVTADECRQWLMTTPLSNAVQALALMLRQLNLLNHSDIDAAERFAILELLRKRLTQAQEESAKRFIGKPLPLVPPEQAAFDSAQAVWQALLKGYGRCIEAELAGGAEPGEELALPFQRALATLAAAQIDIYRAGYEPSARHWHAVHELYGAAERSRAADVEVPDTLRQGKTPSSPRAIYAEIQLIHTASPYELPSRHLAWVFRWSRRWSHKVTIHPAFPVRESENVPLSVDLADNRPAGYQTVEGPGARWLDTSLVRRSIKKRLNMLEKGTSPAELQLGEDCTQPSTGQVLKHVYQRWCRGGVTRKHERTATGAICSIATNIEAIYYHVAGGLPFRQPGSSNDETLRRERDEMATFGRLAPVNLGGQRASGGRTEEWAVMEEWQMINESATGFHAAHAVDEFLDRVNQRQLVGVRPPAASAFLIGSLRWGMMAEDHRLHVGVMILPGKPEAVALRPVDPSGVREPFKPGFLLPEVAAVGSTASIVTPPGIFRVGRVLELVAGKTTRVRLTRLIDRGIDFDRVGFEPLA